MTKTALREFYDSPRAFHGFRLHLTSGKTLEIEHRENLLFANDEDTIVVVAKGQTNVFSILSISEIAEVITLPKPGSKQAQNPKVK